LSFDKPVRSEVLGKLSGVSQLKTAQVIEAADRMWAQMTMASVGRPGGMRGVKGQMQGQPAGLRSHQDRCFTTNRPRFAGMKVGTNPCLIAKENTLRLR